MSLMMFRKYLALDVRTAGRLLHIRRDARPLPRPERRTVRVAPLSMGVLVYGEARS